MLKFIKSKYIIKQIFKNISNKRELILLKNNKKILQRLEITIKDYKYCLKQELKKRFNLIFTDIYELDMIDNKKCCNEIDYFNKFKHIKKLYLGSNSLSYIPLLKFKNLKILNLSNNKINSIESLRNENFKDLKELYLENNLISDIEILKSVKFTKLEILSLGDNNISDISALEKVNFINLKKLYLGNKLADWNRQYHKKKII